MKSLQKKIVEINTLLAERFGIPKRKKNLPDAVDMLVATILSQNTNDRNSYQAFKNLKNKFPDWDMAVLAKRVEIENVIKIAGLGLQKSKAIKNILVSIKKMYNKISLDYIKKLDNESALTVLTRFNGVGVKTASCVLLFSLDRNICPVDTHVHRTSNRIGLVKTKSPDKTFLELNQNFPEKIAHTFHTNLIRLGREICRPHKPKCSVCPVNKLCKYKEKNFAYKNNYLENSFMLLDNV
jgi:endonuclease-3